MRQQYRIQPEESDRTAQNPRNASIMAISAIRDYGAGYISQPQGDVGSILSKRGVKVEVFNYDGTLTIETPNMGSLKSARDEIEEVIFRRKKFKLEAIFHAVKQ